MEVLIGKKMAKYRLIRRSIKILALIFALPVAGASTVKEVVQSNSSSAINLQHKADIADTALKAAPPVAVSGAAAAGFQVNTLIMWATLVYLILQIGFLVYKWKRLHDGPIDFEEKK